MKLNEIQEPLNLKLVTKVVNTDRVIRGGYASDLLSWVMAHAKEHDVWVTIQSHQNIVAVASLLNLAAIIVAENASIDENTINKAEQENIPIYSTDKSIYEVCGILYNLLSKESG
ncbi:AraC family transcriptional regulator [Tepidanaerobacter sp. GT38]|uniref:AraC family transcriptional regulator n=1 Tax=Tepidanaerobacter sp. GT38 TaxID=2722793 RepID=UPI001F3DF932|nr:AraC family transcriptional regulator [Tepidanaerobacter sp. GT38]MCG1011882.1 AraC family transcriptional regulator [Tepidanaerobacter sp. GT38]